MARFLGWNILHGGGPMRTPEIALRVLGHRPDAVVLSEFRRTTGGQIGAVLSDHGLSYQLTTQPGPGTNGILIASRHPIEPGPTPSHAMIARRWLEVSIPAWGLALIGVHVPDDSRPDDKSRFWRALVDRGRELCEKNVVVLGDFNTGRHREDEAGATFGCTGLLGAFCTLGYSDAWRAVNPSAREYSWYSHAGTGFRIDHAFISKCLREKLCAACYSHSERLERVSDHSALVLDVSLGALNGTPERGVCERTG